MRLSVEGQIAEIGKFLCEYRASNSAQQKFSQPLLENTYRDFHCVLIWQSYLDESALSGDLKTRFNEATSDVSQAFLCALMNVYKPSRMVLRSAIENFMRVVVQMSNVEPAEYKTVYQLSDAFMKCQVSKGAAEAASQKLHHLYDQLCNYVHSTTPMHLDLRIPFGEIVGVREAELKSCLNAVREFSQAVNKVLFCLMYKNLAGMHHVHADWIRDRLPSSLKRNIAAS